MIGRMIMMPPACEISKKETLGRKKLSAVNGGWIYIHVEHKSNQLHLFDSSHGNTME